ncbi:MAG: AbrB/MazE/SpoVT family DNA-binding domain-containing protein [Sphingobium sp.]
MTDPNKRVILTVLEEGLVTLPQEFLDHLGAAPGSVLDVRLEQGGSLILRRASSDEG